MPKQPMDRLEKEATTSPSSTVEFDWEGQHFSVLPPNKWKSSGIRALREGILDLWAEKCLTNNSYRAWQQVDPDPDQYESFFQSWQDASGESLPE